MVGYMTDEATSRGAEVAVSTEQPMVARRPKISSSISCERGGKEGRRGECDIGRKVHSPGTSKFGCRKTEGLWPVCDLARSQVSKNLEKKISELYLYDL